MRIRTTSRLPRQAWGAALFSVALLLVVAGCGENSWPLKDSASTTRPAYPAAARSDVVDEYFGTTVADPYRWLEDSDSPDTAAFIAAQNQLVRDFVDGPTRESIKARLEVLMDYPRYSAPRKEGQWYIFSKNTGLQNQSVTYVTRSLKGEDVRVLIDPNALSTDGTVAVSGSTFTHDGELMAYGVSTGGSDQKEIRVRRVEDSTDLPDVLQWCKFANIAWKFDKSGFWYNRYPTPGSVPKEDAARFNKLYWHTLGTTQDQDRILYEPADKELSAAPSISDDGEYLLLYLSRGSAGKNRLYYRKANDPAALGSDGGFIKLFDAEDASYRFIEHDGPVFYILTNLDAPRRRVIAVNINHPEKENWKTIIPESSDTISQINCVNNQFIVSYMHDAHELVKIFDMDGRHAGDIELPGLGSVSGLSGKRTDRETFLTFTSFIDPPTIYRYDFAAGRLEVFRKPEVKFDPSRYTTRQVFVPSKDGTRVPMFITHRKDLSLDGNNPVILGGYGGFNVSQTPGFSTSRIVWLENGGVSCTACLRGGGEYGEDWHDAGRLEKKQNVFDDFIACAQWLIDNRYTSSKRLAIAGGSNGGLLVAACEVQRPDLFGAVLCKVPLTDMLRYHRFSVGRFWVPEYGSADASVDQFNFIRAYSPLQNVKPGTIYPPTIIFTGENDDRVVPLHARKFAAALQAADAGANPILLRTETRAGHGGGKPTAKQINESADEYAFLARVFGITFRSKP